MQFFLQFKLEFSGDLGNGVLILQPTHCLLQNYLGFGKRDYFW